MALVGSRCRFDGVGTVDDVDGDDDNKREYVRSRDDLDRVSSRLRLPTTTTMTMSTRSFNLGDEMRKLRWEWAGMG